MTLRLGVNIDHVATVREARKTTGYPDPLQAAILAEQAGADGITLHLREDRRHIQPDDVKRIKDNISIPLNFEMAATKEMLAFALEIQPRYCCLVPERREEVTTEGGLDVVSHFERLKEITNELKAHDIEVSMFIAPDEAQIIASKEVGATLIELHTGEYANALSKTELEHSLKLIEQSAMFAHKIGLQVNAGHGLNYQNVIPIAAINVIKELNIGHSIVAQSIMIGMTQAVLEMKALMKEARI